MSSSPIGVFDSGLGGLTVLRAIHKELPYENLIYFGDTARVPYGSKSKETVIRYSLEILDFLLQKKVKTVVVACNTASAHALPTLQEKSPVPVLGVVEPGVNSLINRFPDVDKAAVIATRSTVNSHAYRDYLLKLKPQIDLVEKACPLLVPLVEEGLTDHKATEIILREYLEDLVKGGYHHLILGCTHYPLLKTTIERLYPALHLIDASFEVALELKKLLEEKKLSNIEKKSVKIDLFVSDITETFFDLEALFFGKTLRSVEKVVLGE